MNPRNIKTKLLFWFSIIIIIILAIFSYLLLSQFYQQNIKTVDKQLITVLNEINYNKHFYTPFDENEFLIKNLYISIYEHKNNKFEKLNSTKLSPSFNDFIFLKEGELQTFTTKNDIRVLRIHSNKSFKNDIYIEVATTLNDKIEPALNHLENILFILIPLLLFLVTIAVYFIITNSLIPVKKIIDEVKNIEAYKLQKRIPSHTSNDEIEELVTTFNFMLDKLDDSFSKIKRFSNDVSHELKTPLTVIRGEIELGLRKNRTNLEYKDILISNLDEIKSLQDVTDSLLFLSKSNDVEIKQKFEHIDLDETVTEVISINKKLIQEKNIKFDFKKFESVECLGHPLLLKILVGNIIQNAIKYSHKNSKIEVYLDENIFKVKDYGIGIKKDEIEHIFDRFYRIDKSRGRSGYGLGLSIVKSIAKIHAFEITINSKYDVYTEFTINITNIEH